MMVQYNFQWACAKCGNYHNWWVDACDVKSMKFNCRSCFYSNQVKYKVIKNEEQVKCDVSPFISTLNIRQFVDFLPIKPTRDLIASQIENTLTAMTTDEVIHTWCIHDALHYVIGVGFDVRAEQYVRYLEEKFNIGWWAVDPKYNTFKPMIFNTSSITLNRIQEVAQQIKEYL